MGRFGQMKWKNAKCCGLRLITCGIAGSSGRDNEPEPSPVVGQAGVPSTDANERRTVPNCTVTQRPEGVLSPDQDARIRLFVQLHPDREKFKEADSEEVAAMFTKAWADFEKLKTEQEAKKAEAARLAAEEARKQEMASEKSAEIADSLKDDPALSD